MITLALKMGYVQAVDDKPRARLADTLRQQGMQPRQQVVFMSDGADTLRRLRQNITPEAEHVLDWHPVTMRLTVLGQTPLPNVQETGWQRLCPRFVMGSRTGDRLGCHPQAPRSV
jgi:hypothetical protein